MADLTLDDLDRIYGQPKPVTKAKSLDHIDKYGRRFLALSPFCVISAAEITQNGDRARNRRPYLSI